MFGLGGNELMIVLVLVLILFGGAKVPQLMKGLGEGMKEFKKATKDEDEVTPLTTSSVPRAEVRPEVRPTEQSSITTHTEPRV